MNNTKLRNVAIIQKLSPDLAERELLRIDGAINALLASLGEEPREQDVFPSDRLNRVIFLLGLRSRSEEISLEQVLDVASLVAQAMKLF